MDLYGATGVTFHDGTSLNAGAVVFNLQRQWDPAHPYHNGTFEYFGSLFGGFKGDPGLSDHRHHASGPSQVQITLQNPFSPLPSILASPWLAIASPTAVGAGTLEDHPVGTGPFRFAAWTAGDNHPAWRPTGYWRAAPNIGPLTFKIIPNAADRLAALQANTIQVDADFPAYQLRRPADGRLHVVTDPPAAPGTSASTGTTAPLDNPLVRQAIAHALDKPALVSELLTPMHKSPRSSCLRTSGGATRA